MKLFLLSLIVAFCGLATAQSLEPDTGNVFYALGDHPDRLISLERQTATIHTSAKFVGIGATAKSSSEFKPGKSPVRLNSNAIEFVVRSSLSNSPVDFNSFYVLRSLSPKGSKRELIISKSHAFIGVARSSSNLAEGELPITFAKFGEHSLKIMPAQPLRPGEYALSTRAAFLNLLAVSSNRPVLFRSPSRVTVASSCRIMFQGVSIKTSISDRPGSRGGLSSRRVTLVPANLC